jgi:hypothetical protein
MASCPSAVSGNGGHNQTFDVARAIVCGFNLGPDVGYDLLLRHYNPRCQPPWTEKELRHKVEEADRVPFDKPRGWLLTDLLQSETKGGPEQSSTTSSLAPAVAALEPYRPFPVNALPAPLAAFVREGAAALGCDPTYFALPALTAAAAMIGNSRTILLKRGWSEPSVFWAVVIGDSGTLKSPALRTALAPVFRLQRELFRAHEKEMKEYKSEKAAREEAIKKAKKEGKPPDDTMPDEPTPVRILTSDVTVEKLGQLLADNPRGMLVVRDELRGWLASFTRYKGQQAGGGDLPTWLEFFRAEPAIIDRKTGDRCTLYIPRAAVSVCGGVQPETFARALTPEHFEAGLVARLVPAMPPKPPKKFSEAVISPETQKDYEDLLRKLHALKLDTDEQGEPAPFGLRLTPQAKAAWVAFYDRWAVRQAEAEGELAACLAKLEAYAARFALVHHVVTRVAEGQDDCDPVEPASIEAGVALVEWFAYEAERVYAMLHEPTAERQTRRLVEFIWARGGRITARALQRSNRHKYPSAAHAEAALNALTPTYGSWEDGPTTTPKGGQLARHFRLRPTADTTDTTAPGEEFVEDGSPPEAADTIADTTGPPPGNPGENLGTVGRVYCRINTEENFSGKGPLPTEDADALMGSVGSPLGSVGSLTDSGAPAEKPDE